MSMSTAESQRGELLPSWSPALLRACQLTERDSPTARLLPAVGLLKLRRGAVMTRATGRLCTEEAALPPEAEAAESCSQ